MHTVKNVVYYMALQSANHTAIRAVNTICSVISYTNWCGMHTLFLQCGFVVTDTINRNAHINYGRSINI